MCGGGYCIRHGDYRGDKELMDQIIKLIKTWIEERRTGRLVFHFFKGGLSSVGIEETKKLSESKRNDLLDKKSERSKS